jgi:uncharacterized protein YndB with AHSA1/START domain
MLRIAVWAVIVLVALACAVVAIGYLLPKDHVASREAVVPAPADRVFAVIIDVARYPEWRPDVSAVDGVSAAPLRWTEHGANGDIPYEVREQRPPERLVMAISDSSLPFGGTWTYELAPAAGGTRVVITERGEVRNPVFRFMSRLVFSQTATIERYLGALAGRVRTASQVR